MIIVQGGVVEYEAAKANQILSNYVILRYASSTLVQCRDSLKLPSDRLYLGLPSGRLLPATSKGDEQSTTLVDALSSVIGGGDHGGKQQDEAGSFKKSDAGKKKKKGGGGKGKLLD